MAADGALAWLNGELVERAHARVSVDDLGFRYGAGCFETFRGYEGVPFRLDRHLARLRRGLALLGATPPRETLLRDAVEAALSANGLADARLRLTVTAGPDGGTRNLADAGPPTVLVIVDPAESAPPPATALIAAIAVHERDPLRAAKTTNYLPSLLALAEARAAGCDQALLCNSRGEIAEAATANVFAVVDGVVRTPPLEAGALAGVTREAVLECAAAIGVPAVEAALPPGELLRASEAFLTSAGICVRSLAAVRRADGPLADLAAAPGAITAALDAAYRALVERETGSPRAS